jgi:hypothetical protein
LINGPSQLDVQHIQHKLFHPNIENLQPFTHVRTIREQRIDMYNGVA